MPASKSRNTRPPVVRDRVLTALAQSRVGTSRDLGVSAGYLTVLSDNGYVQRVGTVKTSPGRGRPAVQFKLTRKGQGRARTLAKQAA